MTTPVAFQIPYDRKAAISNQVKAGFIIIALVLAACGVLK